MTITIKALAIAATLALPLAAPAAAQNAGQSMLVAQVMNELGRMGFNDVNLDDVTLNELVEIEKVLKGEGSSEANQRTRIENILAE